MHRFVTDLLDLIGILAIVVACGLAAHALALTPAARGLGVTGLLLLGASWVIDRGGRR